MRSYDTQGLQLIQRSLVPSAAFQPLMGQFANVFGRRYLMLFNVALFTLGSGICGGATNAGMLIAGRCVQGAGSGGIQLMNDIVISDLIPLRFRGNYIGAILAIYGVGTTLGPFIGGSIVATTTWRWVFYLNLPIGGVALLALFTFLRVNYNRNTTFQEKMRRIDWVGSAVLIAATVAVLYALAYAGSQYSWGSWHTLVPLLIGFAGFFLFAYTQGGRFAAPEPVMPPRLFATWTSIIISVNTWIMSVLTFWILFFLPVYFQACKLYGPQRSGVALLPQSLVAIPGAALAAAAISRWGRYKPVHMVGFGIFTLGWGLFSLQNPYSSTAQWAIYQCVAAIGGGFMLNSQLPAFQSFVSEKDQAAATAAWGFIRAVGWVWGVAIPATIFNNRINQNAYQISDPVARQLLSEGGAYGAADAAQVKQFSVPVQHEIRHVYSDALQLVWRVGIAFSGFAFLLTLLEKEIKLRENLETEYGMEDEKDRSKRSKKGTQTDVEKHA